MNEKPLISIVMPVYNAMPYLEMAIKSIFAQTYTNWELMIIDDASTDGSWEFVNKINDNRVRLYKNNYRIGLRQTINTIAPEIKSCYFARMDADDVCHPERIETQMQMMFSNRDLDIIGCSLIRTDDKLNLISVQTMPENHNEIIKFIYLNKSILFGPNIKIAEGTIVGKTEWLVKWSAQKSEPYFFDILFRSHYTSKFGNVLKPLYVYRSSGFTVPVSNKFLSTYYKNKTILKYGFKKSNFILSIFGILSGVIRIIIAIITPFAKKIYAKNISKENKSYIKEMIIRVDKIRLPLKNNY